jgi:hypothetical protein
MGGTTHQLVDPKSLPAQNANAHQHTQQPQDHQQFDQGQAC